MKIAVAGATGRVGRHVVDVLEFGGHDVVAMSRASGVDVITGKGLAGALAGVECIVDASSGPSPDQQEATQFFTTAGHNLQEAARNAGVRRMVVVSIIGIDRFTGGYMAAKVAHERLMEAGPIPVQILRAAQFHEFVAQIMDWGRQGDVTYVPKMRTQLVRADGRPGPRRPGHPARILAAKGRRSNPGDCRPSGGEPRRRRRPARRPARRWRSD